jgi:glycosyltransferase involved in cell wall biosynthesis
VDFFTFLTEKSYCNMEILFVSHKYPPATGGMEKHSFELIQGMTKYAAVHTLVYEGKESRISFFLQLQKRILQKLKEHPEIKVIHFNDGLLAAVCSFHSKYRHIPLTTTVHGLDITFPSEFYRKYILQRFNRFSKVIAVSEATAREAIKSGIHQDLVVAIPNGVDTEEAKEISKKDFSVLREKLNLPDKKILLMLGRPVYRKGFSWFIKNVFPLVKNDFQVVMVGPFQAEPTLHEKILYLLPKGLRKKIMLFLGYPSDQVNLREILKTEKGIRHLGHQPYTVIQALFQHSSAFLMPNIGVKGDMEGFGLVCLEASVNGALVLAADIDGIPSAIQHNKNGILIASGNPEAWIAQIQQLNSNDFTETKNAFTKYSIEHYPWDKMVKAYYREFEELTQ